MLVMLALLNIPMFSTVLLLLAGILIGYAICYPFRTDSNEVAYELHEVRRQNESLQEALHGQRQSYARLESKYAEQHTEWTSLRESHHKLEAAWSAFGKDQERLGNSLDGLRRSSEEANEIARREKAERSSLVKKLSAAEDTIEQLQNRLNSAEATCRDLQDNAASGISKDNQALVIALQDELRATRGQLADQQREIEELADGQEVYQGSDDRENNLLLRKKLDEARTIVRKQQKQLEGFARQRATATQLQSELVAKRAMVTELGDELASVRAELVACQSEANQLASNRDDLREERAVVKLITAELHNTRHELESLRSQIRRIESVRDDAVIAHMQAVEQVKDFQHRINEYEEQLERIQTQRAKLVAELRQIQGENGELKSAFAAQRNENEAHHATAVHVSNLETERNKLISTLGQRREQLRLSEAEKNEALVANGQLETRVAQLTSELQQRSGQVEKIQIQRDEVLGRMRQEEARRKKLQRALEDAQQEMIELRKQVLALQAASGIQDNLEESLADARERLQQLTLERDAAFSADSSARDEEVARNRKLQETLETQSARVSELEADATQLREQLDDQMEAFELQSSQLQESAINHDVTAAKLGQAEKTLDELRMVLDTKEETIDWLQREMDDLKAKLIRLERSSDDDTRRDKRRGLVYVKPPATRDDLKEIAGIALVLERKLNDFGIYTYKQIMDWDEVAIDEFSKLLAFRDRIEREHWIDQARRLHNLKYGENRAA